jgi:IclR family mhp operon transcriptional activator
LLPRVRDLFNSLDRENAPTQAIRRLLNDFSTVVKWPAEFMVREGATMVIKVSNRDIAPISLKRFEHIRFPLLNSASGIALLAWSKPRMREDILRAAMAQTRSGDSSNASKHTREQIASALRRGYAMRDYDTPIEGTRAISVPVFSNSAPVAAVVMIYLRDAVLQSQVDTFFVPRLRALAHEIGRSYVVAKGR